MKLISLQLDNQFNSLLPFEKVPFPYFPEKKNIIEPICFIGANGSGKSNLLELITEIFFYVEKEVRFDNKGVRKTEREFVIEYLIFDAKGNETKVRIDSTGDSKWKMAIWQNEDWKFITDDYKKVQEYLPEKIVGYTSGLNETLSYRFAQLNSEYATLVRESGLSNSKEDIPDNRLIFIDYDSNSAILLANYLIKSLTDLKLFEDSLRLKDLEQFKINLDFALGSNKYVKLTSEHRQIIEKLKACATTYNVKEKEIEGRQQYEQCQFIYVVNEATKSAFRHNFNNSPYTLFMAFQKLSLLNNLKLKKKYRYVGGKGIDQMPPKVGFEERIFRFDDIQLKINSPEKVIPYIGISDGEHQFIEVVGSIMLFEQRNVLFLYDEPETHFNPQWRSKLISIINSTTIDRYQEMVQTTHSPFVVSDCRGYNVFKFWRDGEEVHFAPIGIETFGTSIIIILKEAFGKSMLISELARTEINEALESEDVQELQKVFDELGESRDRDLLLEKINRLQTKSKK